jgi:hypothetical protein
MHSFRSLDCTSKLIATLFELKFVLDRTKTECIITNVFAKEAEFRLDAALQNAICFSVMIDSSNHKKIKIVPFFFFEIF